jgi:hypothetical protein
MNNIKSATLNVKLKNFFFRYVEFLKPFHNLTNQEQKVVALFLYYHYKLGKEITNNKVLWKEVFDYDTRRLIIEEVGMQDSVLQNILTSLRKKKVIIDKQISKNYIPDLLDDPKSFVITFNFNINYEQ